MKTTFARILTLIVVCGLTVSVPLKWVGDGSTAHAGAPPQFGSMITVPAGTRILIRLTETLTSEQQRPGGRFSARLETNLMVGGTVLLRRERRSMDRWFRRNRLVEWRGDPNWRCS